MKPKNKDLKISVPPRKSKITYELLEQEESPASEGFFSRLFCCCKPGKKEEVEAGKKKAPKK